MFTNGQSREVRHKQDPFARLTQRRDRFGGTSNGVMSEPDDPIEIENPSPMRFLAS